MEPQPLAPPQPDDLESPHTSQSASLGSSAWTKWRAHVGRLVREPLFHFLLVGAAIFAVYEAMKSGRQPGGPSQSDRAHGG